MNNEIYNIIYYSAKHYFSQETAKKIADIITPNLSSEDYKLLLDVFRMYGNQTIPIIKLAINRTTIFSENDFINSQPDNVTSYTIKFEDKVEDTCIIVFSIDYNARWSTSDIAYAFIATKFRSSSPFIFVRADSVQELYDKIQEDIDRL